MNFKKNKMIFVFACTILAVASIILFQNCSPTSSFGVANLERSAGQTFEDDPTTPQDDLPTGARLKVLYPETTQVEQQNLKVKALLVIDNSGTMLNSQTNLSNNISNLMSELGKYDAEIQVVSSTFSDKDCRYLAACKANALFTDTFVFNAATILVNGQSVAGFRTGQELVKNTVRTFSLNASKQTPAQFDAQIAAVTTKIKDLGTDGTDNESPFAIALHQANDFFKDGDRGLIYIITDENDAHSVDRLIVPTSNISEKTMNRGSTPEPGYTFYITRNIFSTEGGLCPVATGGEGGYGTADMPHKLGQLDFQTIELCRSYLNTVGASCSEPFSCKPFTKGRNPQDVTGPLEGKTLAQVCQAMTSSLNVNEVLTKCVAATFERSNDYSSGPLLKYALGLTKQEIGYNYQTNPRPLKPFIDKFKSSVLSRLKDKYLISVATNVSGQQQNCPLQGVQTVDTFFSSLKNYFSPRHYAVSSICDTAGGSAEGLDKLTRDFLDVIKSNYLIGLSNLEKIETVKVKIPTQTSLIPLALNQDYKIENDEIVLLNQSYRDFQRIEILIKPK